MLNEQDQDFLTKVQVLLSETGTLDATAKSLDMNTSTLYMRLRSMGYRLEKKAYLVPIHAPELENQSAA